MARYREPLKSVQCQKDAVMDALTGIISFCIGLFHRAIVQSGSAYSNWSLQRDAETKGREFASALGCKQTDVAAVLAGLRGVEVRKLVEMEQKFRVSRSDNIE
jgi:carboxylesterase type B